MKKQILILDHIDAKISQLRKAEDLVMPTAGWIYSIRQALGMSMRQLGNMMSITPQSVKEIEEREKSGTITLKVLRQFGQVLNLKLVYGFIPSDGSLEKIIEQRALVLAKEIVNRTSASMKLENQENNPGRLQRAVKEKAEEIRIQMPKYLWD